MKPLYLCPYPLNPLQDERRPSLTHSINHSLTHLPGPRPDEGRDEEGGQRLRGHVSLRVCVVEGDVDGSRTPRRQRQTQLHQVLQGVGHSEEEHGLRAVGLHRHQDLKEWVKEYEMAGYRKRETKRKVGYEWVDEDHRSTWRKGKKVEEEGNTERE